MHSVKVKIKSSLRKNIPDLKAFFLGRYPGFVYGKKSWAESPSPVFVFHEVNAEDLENKLLFLRENNYETLQCDEWVYLLKQRNFGHAKKVLLTFDDGHISLWQHAYPLLKRYNYKAVSFICPGLIPDEEERQDPRQNRKLCNWTEIKAMHESGHVDFQSHGLHHDLVFKSSKLVDFFRPDFLSHYAEKDENMSVISSNEHGFSLTHLSSHGNDSYSDFWGLPIFDLAPRFYTDRRFHLSRLVSQHMQDFTKANGAVSFFKKETWKKQLKREMSRFSRDEIGRYSWGRRYQEEIAEDFILSKQMIEKKLPGKEIRHFCAPWFKVYRNTFKTAADCGYRAVFLGEDVFPFTGQITKPEAVVEVPRISEEYILRLPGEGRIGLADIYRRKYANLST